MDEIVWWLGNFGISVFDWLSHTAQFASQMWWAAVIFLIELPINILHLITSGWSFLGREGVGIWGQILYLCEEIFDFLDHAYREWRVKLLDLLETLWTRVIWLLRTAYLAAVDLLETLYANAVWVLREVWGAVWDWFANWYAYVISLLRDHGRQIYWVLTEGWPWVIWFLITRSRTIFGILETWIEGWDTFVTDPAQAIWDWVTPRLTELVSEFLQLIWDKDLV